MRTPVGNRNLAPSFGFKTTNRLLAPQKKRSDPMKSNAWISLLGVAVLLLTLPLPALAALGGDAASVQDDQARMKGTLKTTEGMTYSVHEIKAGTGTVVREYVSPAGAVFGVSWQGPFIPDMQQLLGTYFDAYSSAAQTQRTAHKGHAPLSIQQPGLVVESNGHMRSYSGRAYDPEKLPQGVTANDIR
jgi:Protein of unknown function (DUF2844)